MKTYADGKKQMINSVTKKTGAKKLSDGREKGSGMTSIAAGTRKKGCSKTHKLGRKKGSGRRNKGASAIIDEAVKLMQTKKYVAMGREAIQPALEEAGFEFVKTGPSKSKWKDNHNGTLQGRRDALIKRMKYIGLKI